MKVLVGIKRVVDYAVKVRIDATKRGVELNNVKMSMNPFCEIAVEEAIRLKEKKIATEIVVVSIGSKQAQETIRTALAMGADRGIHVTTDMRTDQELQPLAVAKVLQAVAVQEKPDLILLGKQAIDGDAAQTGPLLAGLLGWPQATFASAVEMKNGKVQVCRETDSGMETLEMSLPSVITADLRLNEPRYATLPNIMKAKKKPIDAMDLEQFQVDFKPRLIYSQVSHPPERKAGVKVASVDDLLDKLKTEAGVL